MRLSPSASADSITARWLIDLSPGTLTVPAMITLFSIGLQPVPGFFRLAEVGQEAAGIVSADEPFQEGEALPVVPDGAKHLPAVLQDDVLPHLRVAGGDPGEVAESARRVPERNPGVQRGHRVDQRVGHRVRQVGDVGEDVIVQQRVHPQDPGARRFPDPLDAREPRLGVPFRRREDHRPPLEEGSARGGVPGVLRPRDRVPSDELRALPDRSLSGLDHRRLDAAGVGQHRAGVHPPADPPHDLHGPEHGDADEDDVARGDPGLRARAGDGAVLQGLPDVVLPPVAPPDLGSPPASRKRLCERSADQPEREDVAPFRAPACPRVLPTAFAIFFSRETISWKAAGRSDCGPSESAVSGWWWTSTMMPSAPAAIAAAESGSTRLIFPEAWLGSAMTGRWDSSLTTGIAETSKVLRVACS